MHEDTRQSVRLLLNGTPIEIPEAFCQDGYKAQGSDIAGWFQFQPFWDELVAHEPEFLS